MSNFFEFVLISILGTCLFGFLCGVLTVCVCSLLGCDAGTTAALSNSVWTVTWAIGSVVVLVFDVLD